METALPNQKQELMLNIKKNSMPDVNMEVLYLWHFCFEPQSEERGLQIKILLSSRRTRRSLSRKFHAKGKYNMYTVFIYVRA